MSMALVTGLFTGPKGEQDAVDEEREAEYRRQARDPALLADMAGKAMERVREITLRNLEDEKTRIREEAEHTCAKIDMIIESVQRNSLPVLEAMDREISYLAGVREALSKFIPGG